MLRMGGVHCLPYIDIDHCPPLSVVIAVARTIIVIASYRPSSSPYRPTSTASLACSMQLDCMFVRAEYYLLPLTSSRHYFVLLYRTSSRSYHYLLVFPPFQPSVLRPPTTSHTPHGHVLGRSISQLFFNMLQPVLMMIRIYQIANRLFSSLATIITEYNTMRIFSSLLRMAMQ